MTNINKELSRLLNYGLQKELIRSDDLHYCANRMLALLNLQSFEWCEFEPETPDNPAEILENILDFAATQGLLPVNTTTYRDILDTELMNCMTPFPGEIAEKFDRLAERDKTAATDYFYKLSRDNNYIRTARVKKDLMWTAPTKYGDIVITVNLSKPEKDPKDIAAAKNTATSDYPKCMICIENEGFKGNAVKAARGNHRMIPFPLCGEKFFLQYSPYVYYNEHCIILNAKHTPMKIDKVAFQKLLGFVERFPHYFIGSNADLPIVGGSILSHDHFQGGRYEFPMARAEVYRNISINGFDGLEAGLVNWPMSVIRLKSTDTAQLADAAEAILASWQKYSYPSAGILAFTGDTPHNTITPIARFRDGKYELDLVLRNNRTTQQHPDGLFHPHKEYHNLKKENIGLIEVMGLAILPARLKTQLATLQHHLENPESDAELFANDSMSAHFDWYKSLKAKYDGTKPAGEFLENQIGIAFAEILENAGVYKTDDEGKAAFMRFVEQV